MIVPRPIGKLSFSRALSTTTRLLLWVCNSELGGFQLLLRLPWFLVKLNGYSVPFGSNCHNLTGKMTHLILACFFVLSQSGTCHQRSLLD